MQRYRIIFSRVHVSIEYQQNDNGPCHKVKLSRLWVLCFVSFQLWWSVFIRVFWSCFQSCRFLVSHSHSRSSVSMFRSLVSLTHLCPIFTAAFHSFIRFLTVFKFHVGHSFCQILTVIHVFSHTTPQQPQLTLVDRRIWPEWTRQISRSFGSWSVPSGPARGKTLALFKGGSPSLVSELCRACLSLLPLRRGSGWARLYLFLLQGEPRQSRLFLLQRESGQHRLYPLLLWRVSSQLHSLPLCWFLLPRGPKRGPPSPILVPEVAPPGSTSPGWSSGRPPAHLQSLVPCRRMSGHPPGRLLRRWSSARDV